MTLDSYPSLYAVVQNQGFQIVGVTFVLSPEELQGLYPPEFRAAGLRGGWLVWDVAQQWRQIAFAAGKDDQMGLMDAASRVASNLSYSQMRLYDLAAAYSNQLRGWLHDNQIQKHAAFNDRNCFEVYKAIHALFWQMAFLRDTVAEFAAAFCFSRVGITTLRELLRSLHRDPIRDPLGDELLRAADQSSSGWLATFTNYRNCFTHVAPMEQAADIAFAVQDLRILPSGLTVPQIYYALPGDIKELMRKRSRGSLFSTMRELASASARKHDRTTEPDALDYLHRCLNLLAELSLMVAARSPIPPKPIELSEEDFRG